MTGVQTCALPISAVGFIEGDLSEYEKAEFEAYIAVHPEKQKELMLFRKTILQPDRHIVFRRKNRLYHSDLGKMVLLWFARVAAVMALAFIIYHFTTDFIVRKIEPANKVAISENKNEKSQPADLPVDAVKKEEPVSERENIATLRNAAQIKPKTVKNLHESNDNKVDQEKMTGTRIPAEVPDEIKGIDASLHSEFLAHAALVQVRTGKEVMPAFENEERFFWDLVKEKTGLDNLSLNKIAWAGLSLVSSVSREKFNYETNSGGQITELNFESRLLAFTIPTNQE